MLLGCAMVNQIVMMAVMKSTVPSVQKDHINVPITTVSLKNTDVIISMIVKITVMKYMTVSVTYPMSLNVLLVDASIVLGYVMVNQIVMMAVMNQKISVELLLMK